MTNAVGVIGLGAMGSALARTQIKAGYETIVWNRTPTKADALVSEGAIAARTVAEVSRASKVILVCVDKCANAEASLGEALSDGSLDGRIVVQLGTTSPAEARSFANKVIAAGGAALDGAIMCYPDNVGPENQAPLMVGGDLQGIDIARPVLKQITANLVELGENVAAPAALDLGYLTMSLALYAGAAHAARLCEVEGANLEFLAHLSTNGPSATNRIEIVNRSAFALNSLHDGGSLAVWADVAKNIHKHATDAGINDDVTQGLNAFYTKAVDAGFGAEDVAALIKVLR